MKFGIGQSVHRTEDARLLRGEGRYTDDIVPPRSTRMYVVRSPHAHARIGAIDTAAALASPGVVGILTGADAAEDALGGFPTMVRGTAPGGGESLEPPLPVLALGTARYAGEPVAIVIAETVDEAKTAAELLTIEYEPLPGVPSLADAFAANAPLVWPECPGNLHTRDSFGDKAAVDAAFDGAATVVDLDIVVSRVAVSSMEPRTALGIWDENEGRYELTAGVQSPHMIRGLLANCIFKVPLNRIRVAAHDVGGGFGMKGVPHPELALVLWAARRFGRPVRWVAERSESFLSDCHSRDHLAHCELALDENAKFLALRYRGKANLGPYMTLANMHCAFGNIGHLSGVYTFVAVHAEVETYFTNTVPIGPYRGAGRPEATVVVERLVDKAAMKLGMDPADLRERNLIPADQFPFNTGFVFTYDSGDYPEGLRIAREASDWDGFEQRRIASLRRGKLRGIGMAQVVEIAVGLMDEMGSITIEADGSVTIGTGFHNHGQGQETTMRQLASEFLSVPPEKIRYLPSDTDEQPSGFGSAGSRAAVVGGVLIQTIAEKLIAKAKRVAAVLLEADAEEIEFHDGTFSARRTNRSATLAEVAQLAHQPMRLPEGVEAGLSHKQMIRVDGPTFPNACHVCEVEIDPETGKTEFVSYVVCEDVGKAINPMIVAGQMHGGVAQGLGQVLGEFIAYDEDGQLQTGSFMDYQMPRALDLPNIRTIANNVPSPNNPLGIKGAGESGTVGALPAGLNAVCNALQPLGIEHFDMPATPMRVWKAIRDAGGMARLRAAVDAP
ncbi:xanthine dehydrogenase family protein molybdopterin-binding subunit [Croceicoccus sp. BE223]|uniref:xanthine dehydrogenase family protein molybdopterin-binding subunit n=1 Tax=Croceicoccus sp. BE223 TaxID=2817716 RepID=UPI0028560E20|nr:xanthine dehydrogenase family protein molybdopterin-binding subunit [Croceicoccus sp. BE223]MDR7103652.1 carbon-monoxide dehydrogenase large subunit [Croceicoccus sp. BE223]